MNGRTGLSAGSTDHHLQGTPARQPHVVRHVGGCGLRIRSPHADCQRWADPYNAAELRTTTLSSGPVRLRVVWLVCHGCGLTTQHHEATA